MINFTQAFDSAWERMHIILFRPFNFEKWCAIGLSAFLAGLLEGGNGFNTSYNGNNLNGAGFKNTSVQTPTFNIHQFNDNINHAIAGLQIGVIVFIGLVIFAFVFAVIILVYWLGARGQFMFLDNIVRNRGAISWPWQYYKRQANSLFFFYLLFIILSLAVFLPILGAAIFMAIPLFQQQRWPEGGEIGGFIALGLIYLALAVVLSVVMFIFREFGIPLMFRQGLLAKPAFFASMKLIGQYPGSVAVFILLRMAIFVGVAILSLILCCVTCCVELLPYIGTVILLPVLVYVRCFTLDCLAQFGPECNVWTVDVPPSGPTNVPPFSPPPRLG